MSTEFNWKVAGFAGEGIMTTGLLFSKTCARHGLNIFDYTEYPSLIRGGHNTYQVFASLKKAYAQKYNVDLLIALNKNALAFHSPELLENSLVFYDQEDDKIDIASFNLKANVIDLPMVKLALESGGKRVMANNVALGASIYSLGLKLEILNQVIKDVFSKKGEEIVNLNQNAAQAGYDYAKQKSQPLFQINSNPNPNLVTATGNEAIGLGAIAGGLQCYIAYPMTPASSVLHFLAAKSKQGNFVVKHAEDEISSVNMALGASFAGARSMTGTSGGGFCYMTEALGLSGITELPLVIFEAMRPGPALGMPTWTGQGDLLFMINAGNDEFPRFVLTPSDGQEAFELSRKSLELAEKFQTPVILLTDKYLSESRHTFFIENPVYNNSRHGFSENPQQNESGFFPRYQESDNGISPRSTPGTANGTYIANSYEHDQYGFGSEEPSDRKNQMDKRFKKFEQMKKQVPEQFFDVQENSKLTFISFGSTKGVILKAREKLLEDGLATNMLNLSWIWPFPSAQVKNVINDSKNIVVVEGNSQGQLAKLISQETGILLNNHIRRYDGRPFYSEDIVEETKKLL